MTTPGQKAVHEARLRLAGDLKRMVGLTPYANDAVACAAVMEEMYQGVTEYMIRRCLDDGKITGEQAARLTEILTPDMLARFSQEMDEEIMRYEKAADAAGRRGVPELQPA